ncbi:MAG: hypothetical protein DHS20C17_09170 [Cyclobacteriaceae bacterium]|nr:MAG: hypothetical protein DHS20C17_09170 [Cyclobacteriaceae bacterium]
MTPEQALESFQLSPEFRIELFAAEPHVIDPVDIAFDEFGNTYVAEMLDYPYKPDKGKARSRIRYLQDTDQDGRVDFSVIFQDSLSEVTSIYPWKGGLLVCSAPQIKYLKDLDGDHKADSEEVLFTGFFENNSEAQITNLKFNVDNWIYGSNHGNPGSVKFIRKPEIEPVSVQGTDFRFRLDLGLFEPAAGSTQFGQAIDDWGNRFSTQNTIHLSQIVIPWEYLKGDSVNQPKAPVQNISDHDLEMFQLTPAPYWRAERTRRRQERYDTEMMDRIEYAEDHFTGCSGGTIYSANLFPESYHGSVFTGEVAGNLVHRDILVTGQGPLFVAKRHQSESDKEFLASTDSWFRPANLAVAPDGSLLIMDMYRQHIETPLSIPEDLKQDMDFYRGDDMGRIYRIVPKNGTTTPGSQPFPGERVTGDLVELLAHENRWWRLTAQRLLIERQDQSVLPQLKDMLINHPTPIARLHALYALESLAGLNENIISGVLEDSQPQLRVHAIRLAENYPNLVSKLNDMINDQSPLVAFQLALSLSQLESSENQSALTHLQTRFGDDPWFIRAINNE